VVLRDQKIVAMLTEEEREALPWILLPGLLFWFSCRRQQRMLGSAAVACSARPQGHEPPPRAGVLFPRTFRGRDIARERAYSEATATTVDQEIGKLLRDIESNARKILEQHRELLGKLAKTPEERETLDLEDSKALLGSANKADR
jgi:hypothetical protein